jgi:hypothetical protein
MAIIYSYPLNSNILPTDILVCTSTVLVNGKPKNQTKSISIQNLASYLNTSSTNDLNGVLTSGNSSLLNAKIGELYLYDTTELEYGRIKLYDSEFSFYNNLGNATNMISREGIVFFPNANNASLLTTTITANRTYQLPDTSGTIALTSNIPATPTLQDVILVNNFSENAILIDIASAGNVGPAVSGISGEDAGVYGKSDYSTGVYGISDSNYGGYFSSVSSYSLVAAQSAAKPGGGSWSVFSDSRIKENIIPYTKGLTDILLINTVTYDYNGLAGTTKGAKYTGVIAQEMKEIFPDTVKTYKAKLNEDDEEKTELYDFNSSDLTFALINAVKELKAEIEILKVEIEILKVK